MRRIAGLAVIAAAGAWGQTANVRIAPAKVPETATPVSFRILRGIENGIDGHLAAIDVNRPVQNLRDAFAVYLGGYGVALTMEIDIMATPFNFPGMQTPTDEMKARIHKQKLERLPVVVAALKDEMRHAADTLKGAMPDSEMLVFVARVDYRPWEDTTDLPQRQITLRADRKAASMGDIKTVYE
jgi:hypothetical protein